MGLSALVSCTYDRVALSRYDERIGLVHRILQAYFTSPDEGTESVAPSSAERLNRALRTSPITERETRIRFEIEHRVDRTRGVAGRS